ncbi:MAG: Rab family GTPase [Candidatus Heimdallarchaeaceae archaeon]
MQYRNFRIVVVGDGRVGKTALVTRYAKKTFEENYKQTLGVNFYITTINFKNVQVRLVISDTAGHEIFQRLRPSYYKGAKGVVVVYSVTDRKSFENISFWFQEIKANLMGEIPITLIGNKIDLISERKVSTSEVKLLATKLGMNFFECSAKTGHQVNEPFDSIAEEILKLDTTLKL